MWISYDAPAFASLLFAVPLFILLFFLLARHRRQALKEFFQDRQVDASTGQLRSDLASVFRGASFILAYVLGVLALMDPMLHVVSEQTVSESSPAQTTTVRRKTHDVVFLLDVSASMGVKDGRLSRSRLDYAKELIDEIVARLHGETASLYTFTSKVTQVVPGTMDYLYLRMLLRDVEVNSTGVTGTDLGEALKSVYSRFWKHPEQRSVTVVLLSDGGDTSVEDASGSARQAKIDKITGELHRHGVVDVIGVGTAGGGEVPGINQKVRSILDEDLLQAVATAGRGQYLRASDFSSADLAEQLVGSIQEKSVFGSAQGGVLVAGKAIRSETSRHALFQLFLGLALLFLALGLVWPVGKFLLAILCVLFPLGVQADDEAVERASRRGAVYLRARDFEHARSIFQGLLSDDLAVWQKDLLRYDLGVLSLLQQQWTQALEWLEKVERPDQLGADFLDRWRYNRALALYGLASSTVAIDDDERIALLEDALAITKDSVQPLMRNIRMAVKQWLVNLREKQAVNFLTVESPLQGFGVVWAWAGDLKNQLQVVPKEASSTNVKEWLLSYVDAGQIMQTFLPKNAQQIKALLEVVVTQLSYGATQSLPLQLNQLLAELEVAMKPTNDAAGQLQTALVEALAIRPVVLKKAEEMQKKLESMISSYYTLEQSSMTAALASDNDQLKAIYGQQALFWLQEAMQKEQLTTPKETLERAVRQENRAWQLTREATKFPELKSAVSADQQQVLAAIAPFVSQVLEQQRISYAAQTCQQPLWQGVIPLFFQGEAAAKQAGQGAVSLLSMIQSQKEAYRKWSKALEMLSKEQPPQQRSPESEAARKELPKQIKDLSVQDALRLLQSMQEADRRKTPSIPVKQGPKPW